MGEQEEIQEWLPDLEVSLVQVKVALEKSFSSSEHFSISTVACIGTRYATVTQPVLRLLRCYCPPNIVVTVAVTRVVIIPKRLWKQLWINLSDFRILEASHNTV